MVRVTEGSEVVKQTDGKSFNPLHIGAVELTDGLYASKVAKAFNLSWKELKPFNPHIRNWNRIPAGTVLLVPMDRGHSDQTIQPRAAWRVPSRTAHSSPRGPTDYKTLRAGSEHADVKILRQLLSSAGYPKEKLGTQSRITQKDAEAIRWFQRNSSVYRSLGGSVDTVAGRRTWTALLYGPRLTDAPLERPPLLPKELADNKQKTIVTPPAPKLVSAKKQQVNQKQTGGVGMGAYPKIPASRPAWHQTWIGSDGVDAAAQMQRIDGKHFSDAQALPTAVKAYVKFINSDRGPLLQNPYLYVVDYGHTKSTTERGFIFDMRTQQLVKGPFRVAHGRNAGTKEGGVRSQDFDATYGSERSPFSDKQGTNKCALGLFTTEARALEKWEGKYSVSKTETKTYKSPYLRIRGESGDGINGHAFSKKVGQRDHRDLGVHFAPYVNWGTPGRSLGCPSWGDNPGKEWLHKIASSAIFIYAPVDDWKKRDPWVTS